MSSDRLAFGRGESRERKSEVRPQPQEACVISVRVTVIVINFFLTGDYQCNDAIMIFKEHGSGQVKQFPSAASAAIAAQCRSGLWQSSPGGRNHQARCVATVLVGAVTLRAMDLKESTLELTALKSSQGLYHSDMLRVGLCTGAQGCHSCK